MLLNPFTPRVKPESNLESINVAVTFKSVDETLVCDHSNERYSGAVGFLQNEIQDLSLNFELRILGSERVKQRFESN